MAEDKFVMQDPSELSFEDLDRVGVHPNNEVNWENAKNNKDLYRKEQIEELERLKEELSDRTQGRSK